ncbi:sugar ABC transporter ATP-binding protein [Castellaniella sp.]|uniref:sugar ABC transporter ATP-binding protein n=1 Tax=Castellaniella sp. TaxID=1955812 RepID=UPI003566C716
MTQADHGGQVAVSLKSATKYYGRVPAIKDVNFTIRNGEIHALVGENGAGKSTLTKAIAGTVQLSSGQLLVNGKECNFQSPAQAFAEGIAMVYQEDSLIPTLTVAQNLRLGIETPLCKLRTINRDAQELMHSMNFDVDPLEYCSAIGTAKRQMVEIARAVYRQANILIFDEPTATLTPEETQHLFRLLFELREKNFAIVFISHALEEALELADRITVMRDGEIVASDQASAFDRASLVRHMVGRDVSATSQASRARPDAIYKAAPILRVQNIIAGSKVRNMSFSAYRGEVLGIAGLVGSGRTELMEVVAGIRKRNFFKGGMIYLNGKSIRYRVPTQAVQDGIAYVTEDRKVAGFYETMNISENIYMGWLQSKMARWKLAYRKGQETDLATHWIERMQIKSIDGDNKVIELSGGNQQKVTLAKSLVQDPQIIILDEPTRGVDVGAIAEIHALIRSLADDGKAVIVVSSYLPEILSLSDRILVARSGQIVAEMDPAVATQEEIMYVAVH